MKRTNYDYAPEVKLEDGSTVEILYYLGEHSIIRTEKGEVYYVELCRVIL